ncbi:hypothetical protein LCGC14_1038110 [marine sediment metagenome]|uniref:Zinc-ribbon domain-containing protein n=1 Tax=marine sediment metagenome TaxID=412755 RepID=A0A0F9MSP2_9ZZZZ
MTNFCSKCGNPILQEWNTCPNCGKYLRILNSKINIKNDILDIFLSKIDDDEKILYRSPKIVNRKAMLISLFLINMVVSIFLTILSSFISDVLKERIIMAIIFLVIILPIITWIFLKDELKISYFVLTNENLHLYRREQLAMSKRKSRLNKTIQSYPFHSLKGIIFRKRFLDKNHDSGTIEFISDKIIPEIISIKNVPNFPRIQIILESIYFHYGNIQEKWKEIKNNIDYQFPQLYEISEIKLKEQKKIIRISLILFFLIPIICYLIYYLSNIFIDDLSILTNIFAFLIIFGIVSEIFLLIQIFSVLNRSSNKRNQLILNKNEFLLKKNKTTFKISIDKTITIRFLLSKGLFATSRNLLENFDFIKISKSYNSKINIHFGPFTKLPYILSFLFCYLLIWKSKNGHLISKEEISKLM